MMDSDISSSLNLFMRGPVVNPSSGSIDLSITGNASGTTYSHGTLPLFISGTAFNSNMNLFIQGYGDNTNYGSLNLYVGGTWYHAGDGLDLFAVGTISAGSWPSLTLEEWATLSIDEYVALTMSEFGVLDFYTFNTLSLYINGEGQNPGSFATNSHMNLFIKTTPGLEAGLFLHIASAPPTESNIPLFMQGVTGSPNNAINLYTKGIGRPTSMLKLFTRGYNPSLS